MIRLRQTCISEFAFILHINVGQILGWVERSGLGFADDLLRHPTVASQVQHVTHVWFSGVEKGFPQFGWRTQPSNFNNLADVSLEA
jgi:hypothetical protein